MDQTLRRETYFVVITMCMYDLLDRKYNVISHLRPVKCKYVYYIQLLRSKACINVSLQPFFCK